MSDKPILFSAPMVRALLAGTKTQTRRLLPRYEFVPGTSILRVPPDLIIVAPGEVYRPPRIKVGDRLYVREHWRTSALYDETAPRDLRQGAFLHYIADGEEDKRTGVGRNGLHAFGRFRQGMHMPRWASRITLHVTEVRVQRLHEISEADAIAEGIVQHGRFYGLEDADWDDARTRARDAYGDLWTKINGTESWRSNPWVTATSFTVEKVNIDQARAA
jgi:hypothetical protein